MRRHKEIVVENFHSAILLSIAWNSDEGMKNLEKPYVNLNLINKELTRGLLIVSKR